MRPLARRLPTSAITTADTAAIVTMALAHSKASSYANNRMGNRLLDVRYSARAGDRIGCGTAQISQFCVGGGRLCLCTGYRA
jgi:hypothetical protein